MVKEVKGPLMSEELNTEIIDKARQLARLLKDHPVTRRYEESLDKMKEDKEAQEILEKMVMMGRDLNTRLQGGDSDVAGEAEQMFLKEEMEKHPLVQEHILAQKDYLVMIQKVQELIRDPKGSDSSSD